MMFYKFRQNNSGGWFVIDDQVAITVFIEANSAEEANQLAQQHGIYFDGVADGQDCECCGDRWNGVSEADGSEEIEIGKYDGMWVKKGSLSAYVYMLDGTKKTLNKGEQDESIS